MQYCRFLGIGLGNSVLSRHDTKFPAIFFLSSLRAEMLHYSASHNMFNVYNTAMRDNDISLWRCDEKYKPSSQQN